MRRSPVVRPADCGTRRRPVKELSWYRAPCREPESISAGRKARVDQLPASSDLSRSGAGQLGGDDDLAAGAVAIDVVFDGLRQIAVVDHHAVGLVEALGGDVGSPVQAFDARPVAEVEARN